MKLSPSGACRLTAWRLQVARRGIVWAFPEVDWQQVGVAVWQVPRPMCRRFSLPRPPLRLDAFAFALAFARSSVCVCVCVCVCVHGRPD